jgi:carboxypeptidase family protein
MSFVHRVCVLVVFFAVFSAQAFAQGGATGAISGTVQDPSGAAIVGAKIQITNEATGETVRETSTDASGFFTATLLPVGNYSIDVSASGFSSTKFTGVAVRITETARMSAVLKVGAVKQEVVVSAEVATVDTANATTGQALEETAITTLPLSTRNFQFLLDLSAGASASLASGSLLGHGQVAINVNGGRDDNNNYLIEGITATDYSFGELFYTPLPNPDSIQEFKVSTSLYDATQGRNGGGNINAILKSGTDKYHFDAWEYLRNTALDANDFFLKEAGFATPRLQQNIFGADAGGPIGEKAQFGYFYVNYQGTRQRSGDSFGTIIESPAVPILPLDRSAVSLASTFSSPAAPGCAAQTITPGEIDPVALALLNFKSNQFGGDANGDLIPSLNGGVGAGVKSVGPAPGCVPSLNTAPLVLTDVGRFRDDQFTSNWDRSFRGGKDHLSFRFFWADSATFEPFGADSLQIQTGGQPLPNNLNFPLNTPVAARFGSLTETHTFTSNLLNEFRFGVNIIGDKFVNVRSSSIPSAAQLGITQPSGTLDAYRFQFEDFAIGTYPTSTQTVLSDGFVWLDTVSWSHGPHTFRFGGEIDRNTLRRNLPVLDNGLIFFEPGSNFALGDFQNFLTGSPLFGEAGGGQGNHDYRIPAYSVFAQDDFRITKTLTLNLGFRTEFNGAPTDELCGLGNADPTLAPTGQPFVYPSCVSRFKIPGFTGTKKDCGLNNCYATVWEPRIGFAYDLFGHHNTVVRGGYGIYSVREDLGAVDNLSFTAPIFPVGVPFLPGPDSLSCLIFTTPGNCKSAPLVPPLGVVSGNFLPVTSLFQGFPNNDTTQAPIFSGNVNGLIGLSVPFHWISPTTQQWNLTVQRDLGRNWFLEAAYVGTKGTHLRVTFDPNEGTLVGPGFQTPSITITAQNGTPFTITQNTAANVSARAPFQPLAPSAFEAFSPISDSHYNALQLTVAHHFSKGLYFQSAYTYSNSIDDVSTASVAFLTRFNDQLDARDSRGLSDFNRRHRSITSLVYELPFYKNRTGLVGTALGGWETSGVLTLQSGTPFTIIDSAGGTAVGPASPGTITANFAPGATCANALTSGGLQTRLAAWANPAAYASLTLTPVGPDGSTGFGDSPRNCLIGPPQKNMDFTIGKGFRLTERQSLRFRADFFNLTNHPSFASPVAPDVENPKTFAITQVVGNPRLIQFSLKYSY